LAMLSTSLYAGMTTSTRVRVLVDMRQR